MKQVISRNHYQCQEKKEIDYLNFYSGTKNQLKITKLMTFDPAADILCFQFKEKRDVLEGNLPQSRCEKVCHPKFAFELWLAKLILWPVKDKYWNINTKKENSTRNSVTFEDTTPKENRRRQGKRMNMLCTLPTTNNE